MTLFERLAGWVMRNIDWPEIGKVHWVVVDGSEPGVTTVAGSFCVSASLLGEYLPGWRRWPSLDEIIYADLMASMNEANR